MKINYTRVLRAKHKYFLLISAVTLFLIFAFSSNVNIVSFELDLISYIPLVALFGDASNLLQLGQALLLFILSLQFGLNAV